MTQQPISPLRSWLFSPANTIHRLEKAVASAAHAVIADLEDAVPEDEKAAARAALKALLYTTERTNLFVRINALSTPYALDDVEAVVCGQIRGIILPKAESQRDIQVLDWLLGQMEQRYSLASGRIEIVPLLESANGLQNIDAIARSSERVRRLTFGAADFTLDLGMAWSADEQELLPYRSTLVLASRAAGLEAPIDTPWINMGDRRGMAISARRSRDHGFQGKLCIHPDQIDLVHQAYAPAQAEVDEARRIVSAFEATGSAAIRVDGKMIDAPVVEAAQRLLGEVAPHGATPHIR